MQYNNPHTPTPIKTNLYAFLVKQFITYYGRSRLLLLYLP